ncbi:hypothetical protein BDR04DRAFT_1018684, partial [Suillus decipiens]
LIKDGLYINYHLIQVEKDCKELIHYIKCQCHSHIACNCNVSRDVYGTCADNH